MGNFCKGKKATFMVEYEKPFDVDIYEGTVMPRVIRAFPKNFEVYEWFFVEDHKIKDLDGNQALRNMINSVWEDWCKKYKKKYNPILRKITVNETKE